VSYKPDRVFNLLRVLFLCVPLGYVTEELNLPVEELKQPDILPDNTRCEVLVLVQVPVDVPPLADLHGLVLLVQVLLRLLDAVEEDDLEAGDAEEGHGDADFQVGTQVGLHIFPGELGQAVVQGLVKQLLVKDGYL
jgi:hypothetical protein